MYPTAHVRQAVYISPTDHAAPFSSLASLVNHRVCSSTVSSRIHGIYQYLGHHDNNSCNDQLPRTPLPASILSCLHFIITRTVTSPHVFFSPCLLPMSSKADTNARREDPWSHVKRVSAQPSACKSSCNSESMHPHNRLMVMVHIASFINSRRQIKFKMADFTKQQRKIHSRRKFTINDTQREINETLHELLLANHQPQWCKQNTRETRTRMRNSTLYETPAHSTHTAEKEERKTSTRLEKRPHKQKYCSIHHETTNYKNSQNNNTTPSTTNFADTSAITRVHHHLSSDLRHNTDSPKHQPNNNNTGTIYFGLTGPHP